LRRWRARHQERAAAALLRVRRLGLTRFVSRTAGVRRDQLKHRFIVAYTGLFRAPIDQVDLASGAYRLRRLEHRAA